MLRFSPIPKNDVTLKRLNEASKYGYQTGGDATHVAYTDLEETILLFPWREPTDEDPEGSPRWRFALLFKNHHIPKFIEVAEQEQADPYVDVEVDDDWACPSEWELDEDALEVDGDGYLTETTTSLF